MTIDAYINPDFTLVKKFIFLLLALVGIIIWIQRTRNKDIQEN